MMLCRIALMVLARVTLALLVLSVPSLMLPHFLVANEYMDGNADETAGQDREPAGQDRDGDLGNSYQNWGAGVKKNRSKKAIKRDLKKAIAKYYKMNEKITPEELKKAIRKIRRASDRLSKKLERINKEDQAEKDKKNASCCVNLDEFQRISKKSSKRIAKAKAEFEREKTKILEDALKKSNPEAFREYEKTKRTIIKLQNELQRAEKPAKMPVVQP